MKMAINTAAIMAIVVMDRPCCTSGLIVSSGEGSSLVVGSGVGVSPGLVGAGEPVVEGTGLGVLPLPTVTVNVAVATEFENPESSCAVTV
jgi:hypothetical protein